MLAFVLLLAVEAFPADAGLPCEGEVNGVELEPFTTAHGLRGCIGSAQEDDSSLAFALARVRCGEAIVEVTAVASGDVAEDLARLVADSIEAGPLDPLSVDPDVGSEEDDGGAAADEDGDAPGGDG